MKCHHCGFENPEGVRFYGQCATEVNRSCPQCGAANLANFKFCG
ncbi:MAG: zinc ribbon domain-containing protein [Anaerolineales bacterium]